MASPRTARDEGQPLLMAAAHDVCVPPPHSVSRAARARAASGGSVNSSPRVGGGTHGKGGGGAGPADTRDAGELPPLSFMWSVVVPLWRVIVLV